MLEKIKKNKLLSLVVVVYIFLFVFKSDKAFLALKNSMYYIKEMLYVMPVVFILTSIIEAWVPKAVIISGFGEKSGIRGSIFSFLLGSFSAGPIYAAFPICKMLLKKGASVANIVIILSAWAVIKVPMLANEAKFLGIQFMGLRWVLTVISIFIMSNLVAVLVKKESLPIEKDVSQITGVVIEEQYCTGCGVCKKVSPANFEIVDRKAKWKKILLSSEVIEQLNLAMEKCPVKAIKFN